MFGKKRIIKKKKKKTACNYDKEIQAIRTVNDHK